jgi:subtilisin
VSIELTLDATGIADVMVVIDPQGMRAASGLTLMPEEIGRHFVVSPFSQDGALLEMLNSRSGAALQWGAGTTASSVNAVPAPAMRYYPNLGIALGTVDRAGLAGLAAEPAVQQVVPAPQLRLIKPVVAAAANAIGGYTWGLQALGIDQLHAQGLSGAGVRIGHLDTGVDASHPALSGAIHDFAEFDGLGAQVPGAPPRDSAQHGTHTAGTMAGREVHGVRFGVAPGAMLDSALVIEGGNVLARILGGMNWVVGQQVRILGMSLGVPGYKESFLVLTRILRQRGVLPVFAVGNEGAGQSRYPGNYAEALSVGAMDVRHAVADFSSSQHFTRPNDPLVPDLLGPGVDVISCVPEGAYAQMSGTSMATPHIAGLAALLMEAQPGKTIDEIEQAIFNSCQLYPGMITPRANRGFPNGPRALALL